MAWFGKHHGNTPKSQRFQQGNHGSMQSAVRAAVKSRKRDLELYVGDNEHDVRILGSRRLVSISIDTSESPAQMHRHMAGIADRYDKTHKASVELMGTLLDAAGNVRVSKGVELGVVEFFDTVEAALVHLEGDPRVRPDSIWLILTRKRPLKR